MKEPQLYLDISKANPAVPPAPAAPAGGGQGNDAPSGNKRKYVPCPFGGGPECKAHGGNGAPRHIEGSKIMQRHQAAMGKQGGQAAKPEETKAKGEGKPDSSQMMGDHPDFKVEPTTTDKVQGEIASQNPVKELVSSGGGKQESVSSPAAKLEANKQKTADRPTIPIPAEEQKKIQPNPAEMAAAEINKLKGERDAVAAPTEEQKVQKEAQKQLDQEKTVKEAAAKKPAKSKEPRAPANAKDKLLVEHHNDQINSLKDNIQSHIRWNRDMSADEKKKLKTVVDALSAHGTLENMPEAEHKRLLSAAKQMAGEHGKKRYETERKTAAPVEKPAKKKTAKQQMKRIEAATGKDKKAKAKATSLQQDPNRLRAKGEPPPLPSKKEQQKMRLEVDRQKKKEAAAKEREKKAEENKKAREQAQWDKKIEAAKEKIRENTEAPNSPEGVQMQQAFKNESKTLADNIRHHLENSELDDDKRSQLENTLKILDSHSELTGLPSKEQKQAQSTAKKLAGEHGKPPKEPKGDKVPQEKKKRPTPVRQWMGAGYRAGQAAGQAATTPEAAGGAVEAPAYAARGAAGFGHHLLHNRNVDKENAEAKKQAKKTPKKGAEVEQSAMKSLDLYIDLKKAGGQGPMGTTNTPTPERAKVKHEASYAKQPTGVANEGLVQDNEDENEDEKIEKKFKSKAQQKYMYAAAERGDIDEDVVEEFSDKTKNFKKLPEHIKKSFAPASEMLKSLNQKISEEIRAATPSSLEAEFMVDVLGYNVSEVRKGLCFIKGRDRHRFNEWAAERLSKSISNLQQRLY